MQAWNEILSVENFREYARAGDEMLDYLRVLWADGYNSIVIPSRGAMPIYNSAETAWYMQSQKLGSIEERREARLEIINSPVGRELILPFSAEVYKGIIPSLRKTFGDFGRKF